ncbi:ComF family protein [Streptococcus anginosus]|uniref:ComF family protein n=1 Tax=Streptococcus anginosus TaxID=1328 RepID=UPI000C7B4E5B|nr:ComF family protein [Streptococcus anginosus]PLA02490.1 amidophosphoribosyltransferase [Streptococcus anginosus]PLA06260.1 amidophosphoribosyltransferase [Streptococcus anginosus]PLA57886.1 amidophosphoribosyltransferase [Streptococcus anginosus]PLA66520.1 amidophosphoribosyltransferase [Streptococcus anginosus]
MNSCVLCENPLDEKLKFCDLLTLTKPKARACDACFEKFQRISGQHCPKCYRDGASEVCMDCQVWIEKGKEVYHKSCFVYNEAMKDFFSQYKFQGDYALYSVFAAVLQKELKVYRDYALVPIPVSTEKYQTRGFNQVTALLEGAKLPFKEVLEKYDTIAQSSKTREERLQSRQCFKLKDNVQLPPKILLIDDIYTTGSTLQLAKEILVEAGVKEIVTFSLAR